MKENYITRIWFYCYMTNPSVYILNMEVFCAKKFNIQEAIVCFNLSSN